MTRVYSLANSSANSFANSLAADLTALDAMEYSPVKDSVRNVDCRIDIWYEQA